MKMLKVQVPLEDTPEILGLNTAGNSGAMQRLRTQLCDLIIADLIKLSRDTQVPIEMVQPAQSTEIATVPKPKKVFSTKAIRNMQRAQKARWARIKKSQR